MVISVVVPTYNRRQLVHRTLTMLFAQHFPSNLFEIIVVIDGSTDGTADLLRTLEPGCRFRIVEQENRGLAGARNAGFRVAEGPLVLFLDDDMLCDAELVSRHVAAHTAHEPVAVFGAIFLSDDSPRSLASECFNREIGAFHLDRRKDPSTEWHLRESVFSNASLSKEALVKLGGFDERFRMREDLEFGTRLFAAGVGAVYLDNAIALQYYDKTSEDLVRDAEHFAVADVDYDRKHPEFQRYGEVAWSAKRAGWKRNLLGHAASYPAAVDVVLRPFCNFCELFIQTATLCELGVRALQLRRHIHWLHRVLNIEKSERK